MRLILLLNCACLTVPLQFATSKTIVFGKTPLKIGFSIDYYVERPDAFAP